jgi:hypothetical protein
MSPLARCIAKHLLLLTGKDRIIFEQHLPDGVLKAA